MYIRVGVFTRLKNEKNNNNKKKQKKTQNTDANTVLIILRLYPKCLTIVL